jgi:hypothetical protein
MRILLNGGLIVLFFIAMGCDGKASDTNENAPATCGPGDCNQAVGGGTCDDASGRAVCTCTAGYEGGACAGCEEGYAAVENACLPDACSENTCNQSAGGGTCDDGSGQAVCTCNEGFLGPTCSQCRDGYSPQSDGGCTLLSQTAVCAAADVQGETVEAPVLRQTLPASWDENWFASPAAADLNGDGFLEIIAARHSVLYAWTNDGALLWRAAWSFNATDPDEHGSSRMWASPVVGDFNSDGEPEIAVGSDADSSVGLNIAVYDHEGMLLDGWPQVFGNTEIRSIAGGDLDGDGFSEIVVNKTGEGPTTAVYEINGAMRAGWPQVNHETCDPPSPQEECWDFGGYNQNIAVADVDQDGRLDVISSYDAIAFGVFDPDGNPFPANESFADAYITSVEAYNDYALSQQGWGTGDRSEFTYSPPVVADVDADGEMEYVLVGDHEHTESTDNQGVTFWVLNSDLTRPAGWETPKNTDGPEQGDNLGSNIVATLPSPSVGDFDETPGLEILAPSYDGYFYAFAATADLLWQYKFGAGPSPYTGASEALIADLNGDGVPEIIFNTFTSGEPREPEMPAHLIILDNKGNELHKIEIFGRGSMAAPTISDLDNDGQPELLLSLKDTLGGNDGGVQIWDLPGASTNCLLWPTGRGNYLRQGYVR